VGHGGSKASVGFVDCRRGDLEFGFSFFGLVDWGFCRKVVGEGGWV
jgi:hypothetical protein